MESVNTETVWNLFSFISVQFLNLEVHVFYLSINILNPFGLI